MRWMYNITFYYSMGKKKDFEKLMADSSMSLDDIDDIKEVWATKCSENMQLSLLTRCVCYVTLMLLHLDVYLGIMMLMFCWMR
ncbi:hypothetical protein KSS87_006208 [Heliosperma pusillum]|nr:hypothetical protein KSS87_006208 [Heliosperma pusillum]